MSPESPVLVQFRVGAATHPQPAEVLLELHGNAFLEGEVLAITSDGREPENFLVVKVPGLREPVLVPRHSTLPSPVTLGGPGPSRDVPPPCAALPRSWKQSG